MGLDVGSDLSTSILFYRLQPVANGIQGIIVGGYHPSMVACAIELLDQTSGFVIDLISPGAVGEIGSDRQSVRIQF